MKYAYWLHNIKGMTNSKIRILMQVCENAKEIYSLSYESLKKIEGLQAKDAFSIYESKHNEDIDKKWMEFVETGCSFVSIEQSDYPVRLREIMDAPYGIYYRGKLPPKDMKVVSVIGARECSSYGKETAIRLGRLLAKHQIPVISGMARGIDSLAQESCAREGGETYSVLGCGVDVCYPESSRYLYEMSMRQGGVISEYPLGTPAMRRNFPMRNRIISALSDCVIVVEARKKSGTLITVEYALAPGKDIYAVPGSIYDELSCGCIHLIKQGAHILESPEDFLEEWHILQEKSYSQIDFRKILLEKDEALVYSLLDFRPLGIGTIVDKTPFRLPDILRILESLENKGFVREEIPNYFVRIV